MSEEFQPVTRKKWISYNSLTKRTRRVPEKDKIVKDIPEVDVDVFMRRLETLNDRMEESEYFAQAILTIKESLVKLAYSEVCGMKPVPKRLVVFGIGPFTRNYQAMHQLSFILCAQRTLDIAQAVYFDPVFRKNEKEILTKLHCEVMTENCEAKYEADVHTIFYMPHCPNSLTNNLLWKNWDPKLLKNVILINNSFESLSCSKPERLLRLDAAYIMDIMYHGIELPLEDDYDVQNVFNDLSVHVFPPNGLPRQAEFWAKKEAPKYNDVEMISAEQFAKLSLE